MTKNPNSNILAYFSNTFFSDFYQAGTQLGRVGIAHNTYY